MPEAPHFPSDTNPGPGPRDDDWHDLVATVVAVHGSPRVRPPAALLDGLERKLGFDAKPAGWRREPWLLGGVAAALVLMACVLAWRTDSPDTSVASTANHSGAGTRVALQTETRENEPNPPNQERKPAQAPDARLAPGGSVASSASSQPRQDSPAEPSRIASRGNEGPRRGGLSAVAPSANGAYPATADASFGDDEGLIDLKSDYYVVGIIAAALQSPVTANPFEYNLQPIEWSDWRSGHELGQQLPPTEALALGETWTWNDPENLSLVVGISAKGPDTAAAVATPGPQDPPEILAGRAAAPEVDSPPPGVQPPPSDAAAAGESVTKKTRDE